ncbi:MAG: DUF4276 family protein [Sedimentisphaerales bacterium]|nr:DUF4276 family protein [Sedimentisphaerales bacterium]
MSNINVYVIVEGQTEQTFVRDVLAPEMAHKGIFLHPTQIGKPGHKGGDIRFERAKGDIGRFLKQRPNTYISTMFDYFRLESGWPGNINISSSTTAIEKAEAIEAATLERIKELFPDHNVNGRFIPYIEMHEFEALLFSDVSILANKIGVNEARIESILDECQEPEEINDGQDTAPSKRLISLHSGYLKVVMGKTISEAIGIQQIRNKCSHFNGWLTKLEQLPGCANG